MPGSVPPAIHGQKYISLTTFRKSGAPVQLVWFAEQNGKLYIFTNPTSGKVKRIRNNPQVQVAPSTIRGKVTGPDFAAKVRILPGEESAATRKLLERKYWLMKVPFLWSKDNIFAEIKFI